MNYSKFSTGVQLRIFHGLLGRKCSASRAIWVNIPRTLDLEFFPFDDSVKRPRCRAIEY